MYCERWHTGEGGASDVPWDVKRLRDARGSEPQPPAPAYADSPPTTPADTTFLVATDLCDACKADLDTHYKRSLLYDVSADKPYVRIHELGMPVEQVSAIARQAFEDRWNTLLISRDRQISRGLIRYCEKDETDSADIRPERDVPFTDAGNARESLPACIETQTRYGISLYGTVRALVSFDLLPQDDNVACADALRQAIDMYFDLQARRAER